MAPKACSSAFYQAREAPCAQAGVAAILQGHRQCQRTLVAEGKERGPRFHGAQHPFPFQPEGHAGKEEAGKTPGL